MDDHIRYSQSTGVFTHVLRDKETYLGTGWAGRGEGKNKPEMQGVKNTGPLPAGWYRICSPVDHPTVGPYALRLVPHGDNKMHGRDGFLIHGAAVSTAKRGQESKGCPVVARATREAIHALGCEWLEVVA